MRLEEASDDGSVLPFTARMPLLRLCCIPQGGGQWEPLLRAHAWAGLFGRALWTDVIRTEGSERGGNSPVWMSCHFLQVTAPGTQAVVTANRMNCHARLCGDRATCFAIGTQARTQLKPTRHPSEWSYSDNGFKVRLNRSTRRVDQQRRNLSR